MELIKNILETNNKIDINMFKYLFEQLDTITDQFVRGLMIHYISIRNKEIIKYFVEHYPDITVRLLINDSGSNEESNDEDSEDDTGSNDEDSEDDTGSNEDDTEDDTGSNDEDSYGDFYEEDDYR